MNYSSMTKKQLVEELRRIKDCMKKLEEEQHSAEHNRAVARRLSKLVSSLPGGIIIEATDRTILEVNDVFRGMFRIDLPSEALKGLDCREVAQQSKPLFVDGDQFVDRIDQIVSERNPVHKEKIPLADGRIFERDYVPIEIEPGEIEHLWHYRDITARKRDLEALNKNEIIYQHLVENIHDVIFTTDTEGVITYISPMIEQWIEYTPADIVGRPFMQFIYPDDLQGLMGSFRRTLSGAYEPWEFRVKTATGRIRWLRSSSTTLVEDGETTGLTGVLTDITDRRSMEQNLLQTQIELKHQIQFNNALMDSIPNPIFYRDSEGRHIGCNSAFSEFTGFTAEEIRGKTVFDLWPDELARIYHEKDRELLEHKQPQVYEHDVIDKHNNRRNVIFSKAVFHDSNGEPAGVVGVYADITALKIAEIKLQESEKKFRNLAENIPGVIYLCKNDELWSMLYLNDAVHEITGYPKEDFLEGRLSFVDIYHPDDTDRIFREVEMALAERKPFHLVYRVKHRNGEWVWIDEVGVGIYQDERVIMLEGFLTDITDQKIAEEALKKSEQNYRDLYTLFRTISDTMTDMLWAKDLKKRYIFANKAICRNLLKAGDPRDVIGKTDLFFAERIRAERPDDSNWHTFGEICRDSDQVVIDSGEPERFDEFGNVRGKFLFLDVRKSPLFDDEGEMIGVVGSGRDVTLEKETQRKLEESEQKYRHLIQHSGDAIYLLYNRRFEIINDEFTRLFGVTLDDVNSDDFDFINLVAPKSRALVESRLKGRDRGEELGSKYEFTALDVRGREIEVEASVTYIQYKEGMATQGIIRDITERKRLERQLLHAQKMEAVGQLAGGVAHDFNNLLTVISGYCDLLLLKKPRAELIPSIKQIRRAGERAESLVSQLLAYSRKQIIQPETINLNTVITEYVSILSRLLGEDIEISTILDPELKPVFIDPGQIEQILMNVSVNARDAMPDGGRLTLETSNVVVDQKMIQAHSGSTVGSYAMMSLTDTGIGMDEATLSRIFEPFFTTKDREKGTGLGLSSVYGIVKQNRGLVHVSSKPNSGTTFRIYLQVAEELLDEAIGSGSDQPAEEGRETILLVEDDESVREVTRASLSAYGYSVMVASDGEEAMRIFREKEETVDLLLTDVVMPRMSGYELAKNLLKQDPTLKVLFFSGYTDNTVVHRDIELEGMEYIQKPYSHVTLSRKIREVLSG